MSKMMRQPSHTSSISNTTLSPRARLSFFKKRPSRDEPSSDKLFDHAHNERSLSSTFFSLPELELSRSRLSSHSSDPFTANNHDPEYIQLSEHIRRLQKAPSGPEAKNLDAIWDVYKKSREDALELCRTLFQKSQLKGRNGSVNLCPLDTAPSSASVAPITDQRLTLILKYKAIQESMLDSLRAYLLTTFKAYEPDASEQEVEGFLSDKLQRKASIMRWRDTSVHRMKSEKFLFWDVYKIRSLNFDKLRLDLLAIEAILGTEEEEEARDLEVHEYVIAKSGDTILEFANGLDVHPILRFRVSSTRLAEKSPLFAQVFSHPATKGESLEMMTELPPPPTRHICKDGMEVRVFNMPQIELNENDALNLLLHAAHAQYSEVPRTIELPVFISVAEVCLRYRCTSPLALQVECQWLPQWDHLSSEVDPDALVLISYAFGIEAIFTQVTRTAILNSSSELDFDSKEKWPQAVKDKLKAVRAAKMAQIYECCTNAMEEYFRRPVEDNQRQPDMGTLVLTTVPRCPKGSHQCDATNLGWLMLVYNELQILPDLMQSQFTNLPKPPSRSLRELFNRLRSMPSAPQTDTHSGVCDYAPAFRSAINDIYNSITGLSLERDVSGGGSTEATSKGAGEKEMFREVYELPASILQDERKLSFSPLREGVSLRILSYLDDMDDLVAAAMVDKDFYGAYKRNEASLLKNVMRAEKKRTNSRVSKVVPSGAGDRSKSLVSDNIRATTSIAEPPEEDLIDAESITSSSVSIIEEEPPMSDEEAHRILWGSIEPANSRNHSRRGSSMNGLLVVERNEKCLVVDLEHIENKARIEGGEHKILLDEKEKALRVEVQEHEEK